VDHNGTLASPGPGFRFRRAQRLSLPAEFALALRARPIAVSAHFQMFSSRIPHVTDAASALPAAARLGVVVAKRLVRRAVDRNAVKRLVRELFRTLAPGLARRDYVVRVRNPMRALRQPALRTELRNELATLLTGAR
jgi:ribonuclease P protein component